MSNPTDPVFAGNGLESIPANSIEVTPGMKVQYFDIANQNSHIKVVVEKFSDRWMTAWVLLDTITGETDTNTLTGFGWTVVR